MWPMFADDHLAHLAVFPGQKQFIGEIPLPLCRGGLSGCAPRSCSRVVAYTKSVHDDQLYMAVCSADVAFVRNYIRQFLRCTDGATLRRVLQERTCVGANILQRACVPCSEVFEQRYDDCVEIIKLIVPLCDATALQRAFLRVCADHRQLVDILQLLVNLDDTIALSPTAAMKSNFQFIIYGQLRDNAPQYSETALYTALRANHTKVFTWLLSTPTVNPNQNWRATLKPSDWSSDEHWPFIFHTLLRYTNWELPRYLHYDDTPIRRLLACPRLDINLHNSALTAITMAMQVWDLDVTGARLAPEGAWNAVKYILKHALLDVHTIRLSKYCNRRGQ